MKHKATIVLLLFALMLLLIYYPEESFASKRDKAQATVDWFAAHPDSPYTQYRSNIAGGNIVEYESAVRLMKDKALNIQNVMAGLI